MNKKNKENDNKKDGRKEVKDFNSFGTRSIKQYVGFYTKIFSRIFLFLAGLIISSLIYTWLNSKVASSILDPIIFIIGLIGFILIVINFVIFLINLNKPRKNNSNHILRTLSIVSWFLLGFIAAPFT